jgi:hypothetical protein
MFPDWSCRMNRASSFSFESKVLVALFLVFALLRGCVGCSNAADDGCYVLIHTHKDAVKGIGNAFEFLCGWKECECKVSKTSFTCTKGQEIRSLWGSSWERLHPFPSGALVNHFYNSNVNYAWKVPFAKRLRALQEVISDVFHRENQENRTPVRMPTSFFPKTFAPEDPTDLAALLRSLPSRPGLQPGVQHNRRVVHPSGMEVPLEREKPEAMTWIMKPTDGSGGFGTLNTKLAFHGS